MIRYQVFTLFPEILSSFAEETLIKRGIEDGKIGLELVNYRDWGLGKHKKVDAPPYGGGAGMVIRPEPIVSALRDTEERLGERIHKILITPQGRPLTQRRADELSRLESPIGLICGRFEGFDERIRSYVDEEISLGDFILLGGEVAAMAIIEATSRLSHEVIGNQESTEEESFSTDLLEYAQYTKPVEFEGAEVPEVLRSGNHQKIAQWRLENAENRTRQRRPDLYALYKAKKKE